MDVTARLASPIKGQIYLIPSSIKAGEIARVLKEGYDVGLLNDGFHNLVDGLKLDVLMIDTHPGLNEETLLSIALSDALAIIMRPDAQDYQGTGVTVEIARKLDVPRLVLVVNKLPSSLNAQEVKARVERTYNCEVAGVLPHSDEMMTLASSGIFILKYPTHPVSDIYRQIAARLIS
jgi:MinD-like ATPase involved in chromosome partitioning or flagellar assembly